jgi:hypothetical protein
MLSEPIIDVLTSLDTLTVGAGALFYVEARDVTLQSLKNLTIKDGGKLYADQGTSVTYDPEIRSFEPVLGKKVVLSVGISPTAAIDTVIKGESILIGPYAVNANSTFTVAEGAVFTIEEEGILDFTQVTKAPATGATPPIVIEGEVVVNGGTLKVAHPTDIDESIDDVLTYGENGKIVLQVNGANSTTEAYIGPVLYVGKKTSGSAIYRTDNGVIELSPNKFTIASGDVNIAENNYIMGTDTVELAEGTTLTVDNGKTLKVNVGAKIIGNGRLIADTTEIVGGWEVQSTGTTATDEYVLIGAASGTTTITGATTATSKASVGTLVALGSGATITQIGGAANNLQFVTELTANTPVLDLSTGGALNLAPVSFTNAADPAKITLPQYSVIKLGDGTVVATSTSVQTALSNSINSITVAAGLTGTTAASGPSTLSQIIGTASATITGPVQQNSANDPMPRGLSIRAGLPANGT